MKRKYSGILNDPIIELPAVGAALMGYTAEELERKISDQMRQRFDALFEHYGIDPIQPTAWHQLAFELAKDHVPGFQVLSEPKRGRGGEPRQIFTDHDLCLDVLRYVAQGRNVTEASIFLVKKPAYKGELATTLERRFYRADQRLLNIARYAVIGEAKSEGKDELTLQCYADNLFK